MAVTVKQRGPSGYMVARTSATETYVLNGGALGANAAGETVESMSISEIMWSGDWLIDRGGNTVFDTSSAGSHGHLDFQASGMRVEEDDAQLTSDCGCTLTGTGTLVIKFHKASGQ